MSNEVIGYSQSLADKMALNAALFVGVNRINGMITIKSVQTFLFIRNSAALTVQPCVRWVKTPWVQTFPT